MALGPALRALAAMPYYRARALGLAFLQVPALPVGMVEQPVAKARPQALVVRLV